MSAQIAFVLAVTAAWSAHADPNLQRTCTWVHDLKAVGIAGSNGGVLEVCGISGGPPVMNTLYDAPRKDSLGVCTIREHHITLKQDASGRIVRPPDDPLDNSEPQIEILPPPTPAQCPDPKDSAYYLADNMPEGVFLELLRRWRSIKADPSRLDALTEHVPADERNWIGTLKDDLKKRTLDMTTVSGTIDADSRAAGRVASYEMIVRYSDDFDDWYEIYWDWDGGRFVIVGLAMAAD
ncbi:MAG TPA: hypothetical protein VHU87_03370 [Rhizomicrobium sp.]|nr:hypothetical protein [Rhizomicrobium sp.]